jgi:ribose transport system permease protein
MNQVANAGQTGFVLPPVMRSQVFWVSIALCLMILGLTLTVENFFDYRNLFNISRNFSYIAIIALGQMLVIITAGIDLSVGSVMALAALVAAKTMSAGYPLPIGVVAGLLTAALAGGINGTLIVRFRLQPFVVTLGMLTIARSLCLVLTQGRTINAFGPDEGLFLAMGGGTTLGVANPLVVMVILALLMGYMLKLTVWGQHVFAIGGNEQAARLTGVPVERVKLSVYVLCSLLAGTSGVLMAGWLGSASANLGLGYELQIIASAVIGGANLMGGEGGAFGAVVGAALIEVIRNGLLLMGMDPYWQGTFVGVFIIGAVCLDKVRGGRNE